MIMRVIVAKVVHTRIDEFIDLVKNRWAPLLEEHGGKFLGIFKNIKEEEHEVIGLMRFENREHQEKVTQEMGEDQRFKIVNERMRPMLQHIEVRLTEPC